MASVSQGGCVLVITRDLLSVYKLDSVLHGDHAFTMPGEMMWQASLWQSESENGVD